MFKTSPLTSFVPPVHSKARGETCAGVRSVPWPDTLKWALYYVNRQADAGVKLDSWVNSAAMNFWTGCSRADLAVALTYARKWKRPEFREGKLPTPSPAVGLFG